MTNTLCQHILLTYLINPPPLIHPIPSHHILSSHILSYPTLSPHTLSHPILTHPIISHILSSHFLSSHILSHPIPSDQSRPSPRDSSSGDRGVSIGWRFWRASGEHEPFYGGRVRTATTTTGSKKDKYLPRFSHTPPPTNHHHHHHNCHHRPPPPPLPQQQSGGFGLSLAVSQPSPFGAPAAAPAATGAFSFGGGAAAGGGMFGQQPSAFGATQQPATSAFPSFGQQQQQPTTGRLLAGHTHHIMSYISASLLLHTHSHAHKLTHTHPYTHPLSLTHTPILTLPSGAFGQPAAGGMFGAQPQQQPTATTGGLFGAQPAATPFSFGAPAAPAANAPFSFGAPQAQVGLQTRGQGLARRS